MWIRGRRKEGAARIGSGRIDRYVSWVEKKHRRWEPVYHRWIGEDLTAMTGDPREGRVNQSDATVFFAQDTCILS